VPIHENIVKNYANVELFQIDDKDEKDCLGWITILEKCDENVRNELKNENLDLEERKKIAKGLENGFDYLEKVGIWHHDKKLENFHDFPDAFKQGSKFWTKVDCESYFFLKKITKRKRSEYRFFSAKQIRFAFAIFRNKANSHSKFGPLLQD